MTPGAGSGVSSEERDLCSAAVIALAHALDHRDFAGAAALFADDGVWDRHGERLVGPAAIQARLAERPETQLERHIHTTIHVTPAPDGGWTAVSYVLIVRTTAEADDPRPVPATTMMGEFHDRLRVVDGRMRLTHRTAIPVFRL
jgi:hypothetical protein